VAYVFFFQAEDGIRDSSVTGVQTCALPIFRSALDAARADISSRDIDTLRLEISARAASSAERIADRSSDALPTAMLSASRDISKIGRASCRGWRGDAVWWRGTKGSECISGP